MLFSSNNADARLARQERSRLREEGLMIFGFGERKTPDAFRNACHKFVFTEVLRPASADPAPAPKRAVEPAAVATAVTAAAAATPKLDFPREFVLAALEESSDDSGWAPLGTFGSYLNKLQPDFDSRLYGFKKLSDLVKGRTDLFVTEERPTSNGGRRCSTFGPLRSEDMGRAK